MEPGTQLGNSPGQPSSSLSFPFLTCKMGRLKMCLMVLNEIGDAWMLVPCYKNVCDM